MQVHLKTQTTETFIQFSSNELKLKRIKQFLIFTIVSYRLIQECVGLLLCFLLHDDQKWRTRQAVSRDALRCDAERVLLQVLQVRRDVEAKAAVVGQDGRGVLGLNRVRRDRRVGLKFNPSFSWNRFTDRQENKSLVPRAASRINKPAEFVRLACRESTGI